MSQHSQDASVTDGGVAQLPSSMEGRFAPVPRSAKRRPPKLYRIGDLVDYSGVSRQTIHNYTLMGLLHESRWTAGGHRLYDEASFERLDQIADMRAHHQSLRVIREHFSRLDHPVQSEQPG
jgi:hypothetical protein